MKDNKSCTAIFDIKLEKWLKIENDQRDVTDHGILDVWHHQNGKSSLIYFDGIPKGKTRRELGIWRFRGIESGWQKLVTDLPEAYQNASQLAIISSEYCTLK